MSTTTPPHVEVPEVVPAGGFPTTFVSAADVRLIGRALAWRYGTQTDVDDRLLNQWLVDAMPDYLDRHARLNGRVVRLAGRHATIVRRSLALFAEASDIDQPRRADADALWQRLYHQHLARQAAEV
jgi:hypothetical protein